ncbi:hypothetical protein GCM10022251_60420 [Phytohabitans flavus]|uniref:Uncharacterized protein n=1 Tax=Phytohabitans flavus TaxID=1076124 RepID=A0A6F8Y4E2_9ACTN|nr:hypothetical protein Pflav_073370 [Phytohabitans flavus]
MARVVALAVRRAGMLLAGALVLGVRLPAAWVPGLRVLGPGSTAKASPAWRPRTAAAWRLAAAAPWALAAAKATALAWAVLEWRW